MGGKPSRKTPADMRLKRNKAKAAKQQAEAPAYLRRAPSAPPLKKG